MHTCITPPVTANGFDATPITRGVPNVGHLCKLGLFQRLKIELIQIQTTFHIEFQINMCKVRLHVICSQGPFSRTFFVFSIEICIFECNTTSDWLNRVV